MKTSKRTFGFALMGGLLIAALSADIAYARDVQCDPAQDGVFYLDGIFSDWKGVAAQRFESASSVKKGRKHWNNRDDASFSLRCNYSKKHLYLAFDVRDDFFVRSKRRRADDHLRLRFGRRVLKVYPGDLKKIRKSVLWGRRKAKKVQIAEAMRKNGWAVELKMPLSRIPGYRLGGEAIRLSVDFYDVDWRKKLDTVFTSGPLRLIVAQVVANISSFLADMKASQKDIRKRIAADVVGDKRLEQVILLDRRIGVVGDGLPGGGYFFFTLPVRSKKDVRWLKLLDLNGDKQKELVVRFAQRNLQGRREILAVYRFNSVNKFVRPFAAEVLKASGNKRIENRVSFKKRRRKRGIEIVIDKPKAVGFTEASYKEAEDESLHNIMLPWKKKKKRTFRFTNDEYEER
jgi:hypothetical protein